MKNFSKIALLTVLFLTTSNIFAPPPQPSSSLMAVEDIVEQEKVAAAKENKGFFSGIGSTLTGIGSRLKGLITSTPKAEAKKEEPKPSTDPAKPTDPIPVTEKELVAPPVEPTVKTTEPLTEEQKKLLATDPKLKHSSASLAAATGIKPSITSKPTTELVKPADPEKPVPVPAEPEKVTPAPMAEEEKALTLKTGIATKVAIPATEKISTNDDVLDVPASKKEVDEAVATIKATANPTMEAEEKIREYWQAKNSSKRKEKIAATAAISFFTGGIIGVTVVLPFLLRSLAKQLDKAEEEHLKKLQAEAQGAQAKLDALGKEATTLDKLMVGQLGLNPDRLYPESDFNKARGKEDERPTFTKLFRLLDNDPQKFLDAVENLREKEVAIGLTDREKKQLEIIRNLKPEDIAPLGFFGSIAKYFGFPNKNETLEKIKSSWGKKYSSEEIAELKKKHGATTEISEPTKKGEDDQKLKITSPTEKPVDAAKKPRTPEELASEAAAKKQSLTVNQTPKKKGTVIPEIATLDEIVKPTPKTEAPILSEKKEKTPPPPTAAPQTEKIADPLENEEIKKLAPRPSTASGSIKGPKKGSAVVAVTGELIEEVEKALPVKDKTVPLPEVIAPIEPDKAPAPDASTVPAKAPDLVAASSTLDQIKVPPPAPAPVEPVPEEKVATLEKTPPLSPEAETEKTANLAFDAARKALDEAIKIPVNDSEPKAKAEKTKKIQEAEESLSIAEGNLKRAQEAARDASELKATKKKSTQEIVKTTNQIINPTELATEIAKTQSQFNQLPPAPTLEDQKIPTIVDNNWSPEVLTKLQSGKNQTLLTTESTQKAVDVVTEEIKQNAPIIALSKQSGSTVKAFPQAPIKLNLRSAIPEPVEPSNVALTTKEKVAAASDTDKKAQQIAAPEDSIKALQAKITEEAQKKSSRQRELERALSYENDRPDPNSDFDLRMPLDDNIWKTAQEQSKTQGLPQTSLTDPAQFMSRRSERSAPLPPSTDDLTKANPPEVERLTQSVGLGFGASKSVETIARAKELSAQTSALLSSQQRAGVTNPTSLSQASKDRLKAVFEGTAWTPQLSSLPSPKPFKVTEANRRRNMSSNLSSPAVIRPEDIQRQFSTNPPPQKIGSFIKKIQ